MSESRKRRGPHPQDAGLFSDGQVPALRNAASDLSWLLSRGYVNPSALKLVGDRYNLKKRQRIAVARCACGEDDRAGRKDREVPASEVTGRALWVDGFNIITTVEVALGEGVLLHARDGCVRDMASMHGSYRLMADTEAAVRLLAEELVGLAPKGVEWFLDKPVSNSGRLKGVIETVMTQLQLNAQVQLVPDPDRDLAEAPPEVIVATADSDVLDRCGRWFNLVAYVLRNRLPERRLIEI